MNLPIPNFMLNIAFFIIISVVTFMFFKFNNNIQKFSITNYLYLFFVIIIPFILFYLFSKANDNGSSTPIQFKSMLFSGIFIMLIIVGCSYLYSKVTIQIIQ